MTSADRRADLGGGAMGSPYTVGTAFTVTTAGDASRTCATGTPRAARPGTTHTLSLWTDAGREAGIGGGRRRGRRQRLPRDRARHAIRGHGRRRATGSRCRGTCSPGARLADAPPPGSANLTSPAGYLAARHRRVPDASRAATTTSTSCSPRRRRLARHHLQDHVGRLAVGRARGAGPADRVRGRHAPGEHVGPRARVRPRQPRQPAAGPAASPGSGSRVTVDGSPAWTGALQSWGWDRTSRIADLNGHDPIGMLSMRALPERFTMAPISDDLGGPGAVRARLRGVGPGQAVLPGRHLGRRARQPLRRGQRPRRAPPHPVGGAGPPVPAAGRRHRLVRPRRARVTARTVGGRSTAAAWASPRCGG